MNKISKREVIIFSVVAVLFLMIPFMLGTNFSTDGDFYEKPFFKKMLAEYFLLIVFFVFNYQYLTPEFIFKKRYFAYLIAILACFYIIHTIPDYFFHVENIRPKNDLPLRGRKRMEPRRFPVYLIWSTKVLLFACTTFISLLLRQSKRYIEVKEEQQLAEIAYLRAQINPHFLFNTLNSIYALTLQKSDNAPDAVMKLSKMMRYVVSDSSKEMVTLKEDLEYIKNYVQLQRLRITNKDSIQLSIVGDHQQFNISPLLLITFIENAFKYGVVNEDEYPIKINLLIEEGVLTLDVINTISDHQIREDEKSEVGIKNTTKRLDYLYPNKYSLDINQKDDQFLVKLKLDLND